MTAAELLGVQKRLRQRLLDDRQALTWQPARELAAQLLLYVDDPQLCWQIGVEWLRERFGADRVDGGFIDLSQVQYTPMAESLRPDRRVSSVVGVAFDTRDPGVSSVWAERGPLLFGDVANEDRMSLPLRAKLDAIGTRSKLAVALWEDERPIGLLCADWLDRQAQWDRGQVEGLSLLAQDVLGPVLSAVRQLGLIQAGMTAAPVQESAPLAELTPAELKVARLAAQGLSYKEIARQLGRSLSTVDHQLRSVRAKLGARSTARLISALSELSQGD